jgi:uncharacterized protein (TIGR03067 family)
MYAWVIAGSLVIGAPALKDNRKPVQPPAGEWVVERFALHGREFGFVKGDKCWFTPTSRRFARHEYVMYGDDRAGFFENAGTLEVDFTDDKFGVRKGIWKVEGDTLTMCEGQCGKPRPTDFAALAESGQLLWVFKRAKK